MRSLSLSLIFASFIFSAACGVSSNEDIVKAPDAAATDGALATTVTKTVTVTTAGTATTTNANGITATVTSVATATETVTETQTQTVTEIATGTGTGTATQTQANTGLDAGSQPNDAPTQASDIVPVIVYCTLEGGYAVNVESSCSPSAGVHNGRFVCRTVNGKLVPICEATGTVTVDAGALLPDTAPADMGDTAPSVNADSAPTMSPYCSFIGEFPSTLPQSCSPSPGRTDGKFACRLQTDGIVKPICEVFAPQDASAPQDTVPAIDTSPIMDVQGADSTADLLADTVVLDLRPADTGTDTVASNCTTLVANQLTTIVNGQTAACAYGGFEGISTCVNGLMSACLATSVQTSGLRAILDCQLTASYTAKIVFTGNVAANLVFDPSNPNDTSAPSQVCLVGDGAIGGMMATNRSWCNPYSPDSNVQYVFNNVPLQNVSNRITRLTFIGVTASGTTRWSNNTTVIYGMTSTNICSFSSVIVEGDTAKMSAIIPAS